MVEGKESHTVVVVAILAGTKMEISARDVQVGERG